MNKKNNLENKNEKINKKIFVWIKEKINSLKSSTSSKVNDILDEKTVRVFDPKNWEKTDLFEEKYDWLSQNLDKLQKTINPNKLAEKVRLNGKIYENWVKNWLWYKKIDNYVIFWYFVDGKEHWLSYVYKDWALIIARISKNDKPKKWYVYNNGKFYENNWL